MVGSCSVVRGFICIRGLSEGSVVKSRVRTEGGAVSLVKYEQRHIVSIQAVQCQHFVVMLQYVVSYGFGFFGWVEQGRVGYR